MPTPPPVTFTPEQLKKIGALEQPQSSASVLEDCRQFARQLQLESDSPDIYQKTRAQFVCKKLRNSINDSNSHNPCDNIDSLLDAQPMQQRPVMCHLAREAYTDFPAPYRHLDPSMEAPARFRTAKGRLTTLWPPRARSRRAPVRRYVRSTTRSVKSAVRARPRRATAPRSRRSGIAAVRKRNPYCNR